MLYKILKKDDYRDFLIRLIGDYEFFGPVKKDNATHDFVRIKNFDEVDTNYKRTTIAPAKKILFPPTEKLISYEIEDDIKVESAIESSEKILFGIDACDVNGLNFLDKFFTSDFGDDYYLEKRKKLNFPGTGTVL